MNELYDSIREKYGSSISNYYDFISHPSSSQEWLDVHGLKNKKLLLPTILHDISKKQNSADVVERLYERSFGKDEPKIFKINDDKYKLTCDSSILYRYIQSVTTTLSIYYERIQYQINISAIKNLEYLKFDGNVPSIILIDFHQFFPSITDFTILSKKDLLNYSTSLNYLKEYLYENLLSVSQFNCIMKINENFSNIFYSSEKELKDTSPTTLAAFIIWMDLFNDLSNINTSLVTNNIDMNRFESLYDKSKKFYYISISPQSVLFTIMDNKEKFSEKKLLSLLQETAVEICKKKKIIKSTNLEMMKDVHNNSWQTPIWNEIEEGKETLKILRNIYGQIEKNYSLNEENEWNCPVTMWIRENAIRAMKLTIPQFFSEQKLAFRHCQDDMRLKIAPYYEEVRLEKMTKNIHRSKKLSQLELSFTDNSKSSNILSCSKYCKDRFSPPIQYEDEMWHFQIDDNSFNNYMKTINKLNEIIKNKLSEVIESRWELFDYFDKSQYYFILIDVSLVMEDYLEVIKIQLKDFLNSNLGHNVYIQTTSPNKSYFTSTPIKLNEKNLLPITIWLENIQKNLSDNVTQSFQNYQSISNKYENMKNCTLLLDLENFKTLFHEQKKEDLQNLEVVILIYNYNILSSKVEKSIEEFLELSPKSKIHFHLNNCSNLTEIDNRFLSNAISLLRNELKLIEMNKNILVKLKSVNSKEKNKSLLNHKLPIVKENFFLSKSFNVNLSHEVDEDKLISFGDLLDNEKKRNCKIKRSKIYSRYYEKEWKDTKSKIKKEQLISLSEFIREKTFSKTGIIKNLIQFDKDIINNSLKFHYDSDKFNLVSNYEKSQLPITIETFYEYETISGKFLTKIKNFFTFSGFLHDKSEELQDEFVTYQNILEKNRQAMWKLKKRFERISTFYLNISKNKKDWEDITIIVREKNMDKEFVGKRQKNKINIIQFQMDIHGHELSWLIDQNGYVDLNNYDEYTLAYDRPNKSNLIIESIVKKKQDSNFKWTSSICLDISFNK
ncbi:hypothetical protein SNEBB_007139 [Seison nebaliae]|nr:hypothetical protein SNEBB_007139 [Seison nebaliae]